MWYVTVDTLVFPSWLVNLGPTRLRQSSAHLLLFGTHESHFYNSQTTASFLFDVLKRTTIPVAIDDISEKAQETWEVLIVDAYNNTARGTRAVLRTSTNGFCQLALSRWTGESIHTMHHDSIHAAWR